MTAAVDLVDEVVEVVRTLDEATARWAGDENHAAVADAIEATSRAIVLLHRVRDALVAEVRRWDAAHRPYDDRD
jgi:hypothetical protein